VALNEVLVLFEEQERNRRWFEENHDKLVEAYNDRFIAIFEGVVVDSDEDIKRLVDRLEEKYPPERISIEYVSKEKLQLIL